MPDNNRSDLAVLLSGLLENKNLKRKFLNYAGRLLFRNTKNLFARHVLPEDIISSVSLKLLAGEISWNPENLSLASFFCTRIRTEVTNLCKKEKKFISAPVYNSESFSDYEGEFNDDVSMPPEFIINPFGENEIKEELDPLEITNVAFEIFHDSPEEYLVSYPFQDPLSEYSCS